VRLFDAKHVGPGMSDFDREAAREELREKFERDNEKRKTTQRMSELLLKGATMTNRHCDTCGDPIFRYQGQEFCPTCQNATVDGGPDSVQDETDQPTPVSAESAADSTTPATDAATAGRQAGDGDASVPVEPASPDRQQPTPADHQQATTTGDRQQPTTTGDRQQPTTTGDRQQPTTTGDRQQPTTPAESAESPTAGGETAEPQPAPLAGDTADLDTARASLVRTLTRYSREAESADDPRRAKELLSVARESAETLAALDRTR
jgi:uncharacterized Zn finger protein (UPF0148 family)